MMTHSLTQENTYQEIDLLLRQLQQIEERLEALTGGRVDTLMTPAGRSHMLGSMQQRLRQSEAQLKRSLEQILRSESLLRNALRSSKMGTWETDLKTGRVHWSDETYRIFEVQTGEFGETFDDFKQRVHEEDRANLDAVLQAANQTGGYFEVDYRIVISGGRERMICQRGETILDSAGNPARRLGIVMDVTEQRARESELREKTELLEIAGTAAKLGGWSTDLADKQMKWSDQVCAIHEVPFGKRPSFDEAIESIVPECRETILKALHDCAEKGEPFDLELEIITARQNRRSVRVIGHAIKNASGKITHIQGALQDITELKQLEARFRRAQRMESIGTLAGGIAHDLNNILAPILMSSDLLQNRSQLKEFGDMGRVIHRSAQRGADLIQQLLSFARGMEGKRVAINLRHIAREIQKMARETFPKNIRFRLLAPNDLQMIRGDPTQIHQVLMNLCVNARDAMPKGGELDLKLKNIEVDEFYAGQNQDAKPGPYVAMEVVDTGEGIAREHVEKIFEPFFTTKELGSGTGLGLSTTLGIVKSHGGFINVYSEKGKGTTFRIYFPAESIAEAADPDAKSKDSALPRGKGELILVVDDEENIRGLAKKTLERYGYHVLIASNGAEAVSLYAQSHRDIALVLTDMNMPVMGGVTTILALRHINPEVKIIASSGLPSKGGYGEAVDAGVDVFIPKPYSAATLLTKVRESLKGGE